MVGAFVRSGAADARVDVITTHLNPSWLDPDSYISLLNRSFAERWDRRAYEFYVARSFNGVKGDIVVQAEGSRILAAVSLCYRQVILEGGSVLDVCVAGAGATLPGERRHGHYRRLLQAALERCRQRSSVALLGFVSRGNSSGRGLTRIGARAIPSFYITSTHLPLIRDQVPSRSRASKAVEVVHSKDCLALILATRARQQIRACNPAGGDKAYFHYEHIDDWVRQFMHRPNAVRAIRMAHDSVALVETVGPTSRPAGAPYARARQRSTDRLQWLACPRGRIIENIATLASASAAVGRHFFMYTLDPLQAQAAKRVGLKVRGGYLMVLPTGAARASDSELVARASWQLQSGDRL